MDSRKALIERMVDLAIRRGVTIDAARAEVLAPAVASLLERLDALARSLDPEDAASPGPRDPEGA